MAANNPPVLRDFDVLLQKKLGDKLIVDSFEPTNLVSPGENTGSTIYKVDVIVRRNGRDSEPEKLALVAKMLPPQLVQDMVDMPHTFRKEASMFEQIIPEYVAIERESGIPESELFDGAPDYFGTRFSLDEGDDKFDDDAVILMENLKIKNYYCCERKVGLDFAHCKLLVEALARFHSLGVALKLKKPTLFMELKKLTKPVEFDHNLISSSDTAILSNLKKCPSLIPHIDKIEKFFRDFKTEMLFATPDEPWGSIVHTDLWLNNIMFCADDIGNPTKVKLIDFQNYLYSNPTRDLIVSLLSSAKQEIRDKHLDEMIDLYYHTFVSHLERLDCNVESFTRDSFDKQLAAAARLEYKHCLMILKVLSQEDPKELHDVSAIVGTLCATDYSPNVLKTMTKVTLQLIEKNWL